MKQIKRILTLALSFIAVHAALAQTVVKMEVPPQAQEPLAVVVLFDEQVPEGIPVVLGLMGYDVTGGIEPYTYEWIQNGTVIGTGDIVVITPAKGDKFELKATDKNRCHSVSAFSMNVISRISASNSPELMGYSVFPTLVRDDRLRVNLPASDEPVPTRIRILDVNGVVHYQSIVTASTTISCNLPDGTFFVSVQTDQLHKVYKISVKH